MSGASITPYLFMSAQAPTSILVGTQNKIVWMRVVGKGTFLCSGSLKEFTREMINRGHREFVLDLAECPVMDSTFMGTLAGVALRLRELGQGRLYVTNINERNTDLLQGLGLDHLFSLNLTGLSNPDPEPEAALQAPASDEAGADTARMMLEAHEALIAADPSNLTKFKDVLEYLKQDLQQSAPE